jgi:hypothetical protein
MDMYRTVADTASPFDLTGRRINAREIDTRTRSRRGWRKTDAHLPVHPPGLEGADRRPSRGRQDADIEEVAVQGKQAMSVSYDEEYENECDDDERAWRDEVGNRITRWSRQR